MAIPRWLMILISGAGGKTGKAIIRALADHKEKIRVLVRRPTQAEECTRLGAAEAVLGEMEDPMTWSKVCEGVRAVYHICPNMHPDELAIGRMALAASNANGVDHFIYHSVLHPQVEEMPHHWQKMRVEGEIFKCGLSFTILQPAAYFQNVSGYWDKMVEQGVYPVPYSIDSRQSMVDLQDVAEVAALVITQPGHTGATYELCGPQALSARELSETISQRVGVEIRAFSQDRTIWEEQARKNGLSAYSLETLLKMFSYYESHNFIGNSNTLKWLLQRPPTGFQEFVGRYFMKR